MPEGDEDEMAEQSDKFEKVIMDEHMMLSLLACVARREGQLKPNPMGLPKHSTASSSAPIDLSTFLSVVYEISSIGEKLLKKHKMAKELKKRDYVFFKYMPELREAIYEANRRGKACLFGNCFQLQGDRAAVFVYKLHQTKAVYRQGCRIAEHYASWTNLADDDDQQRALRKNEKITLKLEQFLDKEYKGKKR